MIVRYLPLAAFTIALISGAFQVQADTTPSWQSDLEKLKPFQPPPGPDLTACANLVGYVRLKRPMSEILEKVEGCNNHPDKLICEVSGEMISDMNVDSKKLGLTCKNSN